MYPPPGPRQFYVHEYRQRVYALTWGPERGFEMPANLLQVVLPDEGLRVLRVQAIARLMGLEGFAIETYRARARLLADHVFPGMADTRIVTAKLLARSYPGAVFPVDRTPLP